LIKPFYQDEPSPTREIITYDRTNYLVEHEGYCMPVVIKPPDKPKRMVKDVAGIQKPLME